MEIVLKQGDRLPVPEGCRAVVEGDVVLIEREEQDFKDGDIIAKNKAVAILKGGFNNGVFRDYACLNFDGKVLISNDTEWSTLPAGWHIATEEERQLLFDKMAEQGLRWNAEEKRVEKIRWRAEIGEFYYTLGVHLNVCKETEENFGKDDKAFRSGIYFRTYKQAKKATEVVKEALKKFHEENEENL